MSLCTVISCDIVPFMVLSVPSGDPGLNVCVQYEVPLNLFTFILFRSTWMFLSQSVVFVAPVIVIDMKSLFGIKVIS